MIVSYYNACARQVELLVKEVIDSHMAYFSIPGDNRTVRTAKVNWQK